MNGNVEIRNLNIQLSDLKKNRLNLEFLDSIREINGYLLISNNSIQRLRFDNLYLIRGDQLVNESSLIIANNLNLSSVILQNLKHIEHGVVRIQDNRKLCHIQTINWNEFFEHSNESRVVLVNNNNECNIQENVCSLKNFWSENVCQKCNKFIFYLP